MVKSGRGARYACNAHALARGAYVESRRARKRGGALARSAGLPLSGDASGIYNIHYIQK